MFGSSVLVKRKAIPDLATAMQRSSMENYLKRHTFASSGDTNRDVDIERRQWFSGQAFLSELLGACLKGTKLKGSNHVLVKDFTMYDAELAKHVIAQNSTTGQACRLGYFAVLCIGSTTNKETVAQNVQRCAGEGEDGHPAEQVPFGSNPKQLSGKAPAGCSTTG